MILNAKPLSMAEANELISKNDKKPIHDYFKAFAKADFEKAVKIRETLSAMNNPKFKEAHLVKVIDILPTDAEEVHKIFNDVSLSEEEVNTILNVLQK